MKPVAPGPGPSRPVGDGRGPAPAEAPSRQTLRDSTTEEVVAAVARARSLQPAWASLGVRDRTRRMAALLPVVASRKDRVIEMIQAETGKPEAEAAAEVLVVVDLVRYYVKHATRQLRPARRGTGWVLGRRATVLHEPFGVIAVISPWNYPFILGMNPVVTALFAGNGVVYKPSEHSPLTGLLVLELLAEANVPEGLTKVVVGGPAVGAALVSAGVDKVVFTGGQSAGRAVMRSAAEHLTPVVMELGGKDAAIVLADADLDRTAAGLLFGAFFNAGQTCISVERAFVERPIYEAFLTRITEMAGRLRSGTDGADVGPMTAPTQLQVVERHVADAISKGARALTGGRRADPASNIVLPTILVDVDESMAVLRDETFGPVLAVVPVDNADEAVKRVNEGASNLFASIWTGDLDRGEALAGRLRAGGVSVNDVLSHYAIPSLPMGGVGSSGFGRTGGPEGLKEMTRTRTLLMRRWSLRKREFYWFPYRERTADLFRALADWRAGIGLGRALRALLRRPSRS